MPPEPIRVDEEAEPLLLRLSNDGKQIVLLASQRKARIDAEASGCKRDVP